MTTSLVDMDCLSHNHQGHTGLLVLACELEFLDSPTQVDPLFVFGGLILDLDQFESLKSHVISNNVRQLTGKWKNIDWKGANRWQGRIWPSLIFGRPPFLCREVGWTMLELCANKLIYAFVHRVVCGETILSACAWEAWRDLVFVYLKNTLQQYGERKWVVSFIEHVITYMETGSTVCTILHKVEQPVTSNWVLYKRIMAKDLLLLRVKINIIIRKIGLK